MLSLAADDFLSLADSKLRWIDARTRVLAGNIANADTPGYVAHDLSPFPDTLSSFDIAMTRTDPADLGGVDEQSPVIAAGESERSIDGNGISLDQQMRLVAENDQDQRLVTTLYKKYIGMTDLALGASA